MNTIDAMENAVIDIIKATLKPVNCDLLPETLLTIPQQRLSLKLPGIFIHCDNLTINRNDGTERLVCDTQWSAVIMVAKKALNDKAHNVARNFGLQIATLLNGNTLNVAHCQAINVTQAEPMSMDDELGRLIAAYQLNWQQQIYLGDSVWDTDAGLLTPEIVEWSQHATQQ